MKKTYFLLGGVTAIALLLVGLASASAFGPAKGDTQHGQRFANRPTQKEMQQHHDKMQEIMNADSFDAWKAAIEADVPDVGHESRMLEKITAENFDQFKQMHELMQAGDKDGARKLAEDLGLEGIEKKGHMMGKRGHKIGQFKDTNGDGLCDRADIEAESAPIQS